MDKIRSSKELKEGIENVDKVFENELLDAHVAIDPVLADAYIQNKEIELHVEETIDELNDKAEEVIEENPEAPLAVENVYTASLKLDESIEDFRLVEDGRSHAAPRSDDWEEEYLEYDMARFVSGLCGGEDYPKPLSPLGRRMKTFQSGSRDKYVNTVDGEPEALVGTPQVIPEDKYVTIYAQKSLTLSNLIELFEGDKERAKRVYRSELGQISSASPDYEPLDRSSAEYIAFLSNNDGTSGLDSAKAFDDIKAACEIYELEYTKPIPKRSRASHWDYSMKVMIPLEDNGLPMTLEEYFGGLRDTGNLYFVGLTDDEIIYKILPAEFARKYLKYKHQVEAEQEEMAKELEAKKLAAEAAEEDIDEIEVAQDLVTEYIRRASLDATTPLNTFRDSLKAELADLSIDTADYLAQFDAEFAEDSDEE